MAVLHMGVLHNIMAYGGQETTAVEKSCPLCHLGSRKEEEMRGQEFNILFKGTHAMTHLPPIGRTSHFQWLSGFSAKLLEASQVSLPSHAPIPEPGNVSHVSLASFTPWNQPLLASW